MPDPCPRLDDRAVEAATRAFAVQSTQGNARDPGYVAMIERRMRPALAAYFAALDPETRAFPMMDGPPIPWALAEVIHEHLYRHSQPLEQVARRGGFGWGEVAFMWSDRHQTTPEQRQACRLAALGLSTPDTEEPT